MSELIQVPKLNVLHLKTLLWCDSHLSKFDILSYKTGMSGISNIKWFPPKYSVILLVLAVKTDKYFAHFPKTAI